MSETIAVYCIGMAPKATPLYQRFDSKVDNSGECWIWKGTLVAKGYGVISVQVDGKTQRRYAHRLAYERANGPVPEGKQVNHHCDVRACVRPQHLYAGSQSDNISDRDSRGRNHNANKTHCPRGHAYEGDNVTISPGGSRRCRACHRDAVRASYQRRPRAQIA